MRAILTSVLLLVSLVSTASLSAQQSFSTSVAAGPQSAQTATLLQQSLAVMTGGLPVTDVTMTGTITISGLTTGSGTVNFIATASGQGQLTITLPSGARTEVRSHAAGSQTLTVAGPDGVAHAVHTLSVLSPHPSCLFPALVLNSGLSSSDHASSYVGLGAWNGATAHHIVIWLQTSNTLAMSAADLQRLSQHDIYLDPSTMLPVAMTFTVHPYSPTNPDAPIMPYRGSEVDPTEQVTFSDYRQVQGRAVPFHVQTSVTLPGGALVSDFQFSSVRLNTGAAVDAN
jgi:hypothetical protein